MNRAVNSLVGFVRTEDGKIELLAGDLGSFCSFS